MLRQGYLKLRKIKHIYLKRMLWGVLYAPLAFVMPKKKIMVMKSRFGELDGNINYFYQYMKELPEEEKEGLQVVFLTEKPAVEKQLKQAGEQVWLYPKPSTLWKLLQAKVLVVDGNEWAGTKLRFILMGAVKVQLWHGTGMKSIGLLKPSTQKFSPWKRRFKKEDVHYDLLVLTSEEQIKNRAKAFRYSSLLLNGYPRNDIFFKRDKSQEQKRKKIVMYAPTWRKNSPYMTHLDLERIEEQCRQKGWQFVIKFHPKCEWKPDVSRFPNIRMVDSREDSYPWLAMADLLITDYSSIFQDYLLLDRPILFFPYDKAAYINGERALLLDYDQTVPGPQALTQDSLQQYMEEMLVEGADPYKDQRREARKTFFHYQDGKSSQRLWNHINKQYLLPQKPSGLKKWLKALWTWWLKLMPKRNKILLISRDDGFSGNVKYLYLKAKEEGKAGSFVWLTEKKEVYETLKKNHIPCWYYPKVSTILKLMQVKWLVVECNTWGRNRKAAWLMAASKIQLWHGNGIKEIAGLRHPKRPKFYYDLVSFSSEKQMEIRGDAFWCRHRWINGQPRTDVLFRDFEGQRIGIDMAVEQQVIKRKAKGEKVLLYAPTYREKEEREQAIDWDKMEVFLERRALSLVVKAHLYTQGLGLSRKYDRIMEYPAEMDVYPLMKQVDLLVTDYSSIYIDFLLLDRPIVFYGYDEESYVKHQRNLMLSYHEVTPGEKCRTQEALEETLDKILVKGIDLDGRQREKARQVFFEYQDGNDAKRLLDKVLTLQQEG